LHVQRCRCRSRRTERPRWVHVQVAVAVKEDDQDQDHHDEGASFTTRRGLFTTTRAPFTKLSGTDP
jgi:hypothetical protein